MGLQLKEAGRETGTNASGAEAKLKKKLNRAESLSTRLELMLAQRSARASTLKRDLHLSDATSTNIKTKTLEKVSAPLKELGYSNLLPSFV